MSNLLKEKMKGTAYTPAQRLRIVAQSLREFWGPLANIPIATAEGDALCLIEVAELLEKINGD